MRKTRTITQICFFLLAMVFTSSAWASKIQEDKKALEVLQNQDFDSVDASSLSEEKEKAIAETSLRLSAIREAGTAIAVQKAVKHRYQQINDDLEKISYELDQVYDFGPLVEHEGRILPPIISEVHNSLQIKSSTESISSQVVYKIIQNARIIPVAPTWRQYLVKNYGAIEDVNKVLLPKTAAEKKIWAQAVEKGWEIGLEQADRLFDANLARLERDYKGLLKFKLLSKQGIVSLPMVAEGEFGIKVGNKTLDVDQKIFRITKASDFNEAEKWEPLGYTKTSR